MNGVVRFAVAAASVVVIAGCTETGGQWHFGSFGCSPSDPEALAAFEWDKAETVDVRIRQSDYTPMIMHFVKDRPYVLRFTNADETSRSFRASRFFDSVALRSVSAPDTEPGPLCLDGLTIPAGGTAEVAFVPLKDGRYPYQRSPLPPIIRYPDAGVILVR